MISCILHVDHSPDSEPWPIFIEDFQGNTNQVVLESGDMLFYESSKCHHGRPTKFNGSWYTSVFVHYIPTEYDREGAMLETQYAIPPHWNQVKPSDPNVPELSLADMALKVSPQIPLNVFILFEYSATNIVL